MRRASILVLLFLFGGLAIVAQSRADEFRPVPIADYEVFSEVLERHYPLPNANAWGDTVTALICRQTTRWAEVKHRWPDDHLKIIRGGPYPGIDSLDVALRQDFVHNNMVPAVLDAELFRADVRPEPESIRHMPSDYWQLLHQGWPEVWGVLVVSSVGYNLDRSQALVIVGFGDSAMSGEGYLYHLRRVGDAAWAIERRWTVWFS